MSHTVAEHLDFYADLHTAQHNNGIEHEHADRTAHGSIDADVDAHRRANEHPDGDQHANSNVIGDANAYQHADTAHIDAKRHGDADQHGRTDQHADGDGNHRTAADADRFSLGHTDPATGHLYTG